MTNEIIENRTNISNLQPGSEIEGVFALHGKKLLPFKNGSGYFLGVTLADNTGQIEGRVWDNAEEINKCCRAVMWSE